MAQAGICPLHYGLLPEEVGHGIRHHAIIENVSCDEWTVIKSYCKTCVSCALCRMSEVACSSDSECSSGSPPVNEVHKSHFFLHGPLLDFHLACKLTLPSCSGLPTTERQLPPRYWSSASSSMRPTDRRPLLGLLWSVSSWCPSHALGNRTGRRTTQSALPFCHDCSRRPRNFEGLDL